MVIAGVRHFDLAEQFVGLSPSPKWVVDAAGRYVFANPALCRLLGVESVLNKRNADLIAADDARQMDHFNEGVLRERCTMQDPVRTRLGAAPRGSPSS